MKFKMKALAGGAGGGVVSVHRNVRAAFISQEICISRLETHAIVSCPVCVGATGDTQLDGNLEEEAKVAKSCRQILFTSLTGRKKNRL